MNHNVNIEHKNIKNIKNINKKSIKRRTKRSLKIDYYLSFLNFINSQILVKVENLISENNYQDAAYWNSILFYFKNNISEEEKLNINNKWSEAFQNAYDIKTWIKNKINSFDISNKELGSSEENIRIKTVNRILNKFKFETNNLNIPSLDEIIPSLIENNVHLILQDYSPKWENKNDNDVVKIIEEFKLKKDIIKRKWIEEFNKNSSIFALGFENYIQNYIKNNIFNSFSIIIKKLIDSLARSKEWKFKNNYNNLDLEKLNKINFSINEIDLILINNFKSEIQKFLKLNDDSKVQFFNFILSKSEIKKDKNDFSYYDYYLDTTIELILNGKKATKNVRFTINNVLVYNPKEEFNSILNDLINHINDKKIFQIENINLLTTSINSIEKLINFFKNNGVQSNNFYLSKLLKFSLRFPTFQLQRLRVQFIDPNIDIEFLLFSKENEDVTLGKVLTKESQHRNIKLEFNFLDTKKMDFLNLKILSKNLNIHSEIFEIIKEIEDFFKKNKTKYIFKDEWLLNSKNIIRKKAEDIFPNNIEWKNILNKLKSFDFFYQRSDSEKIMFSIAKLLNWKYENSQSSNDYDGWKSSFSGNFAIWKSKFVKYNANSQKDYLEKIINEKLILQKKVNKETFELIEKNNLQYIENEFFENINELSQEVINLKIKYNSKFKIDYNPKKYYVEFSFFDNSNKFLYKIVKNIWEKVSEKELEKTKKEVKELYEKSKEKLSKLKLKEKSDKFNKKLDDLYQETRFKKLENKKLDKFQLENIVNDYKTNMSRLWEEILKQKYEEKKEEIQNLKGAFDEDKKRLLEKLDKDLLEKLQKLSEKKLNLNDFSKLLNSMDLNFKKIIDSKFIISKTFKYALVTSASFLGIGSLISGGTTISLIKSKKVFKKSKLKIKSRKGLIMFTTLVGLASAIGSIGLSLFVFVSQGGF